MPTVHLREVHEGDEDLLAQLGSAEVEGEWNTFDDPKESMLNGADYGGGRLIVELDEGPAIGVVTWIQIPYGPNQLSLAWNIGITILPAYRGRRIGASAQRTLASWLFAASDANRIVADTDIGNIAEQRSLERAGFLREGVARGAQWRRGVWHDRVVYSLLRSD